MIISAFMFLVWSTVEALKGKQTPMKRCIDIAVVIHTEMVCASVMKAYMNGAE